MQALTASTTAVVSPPAVALRVMSDERLARWAAKGSQPAFSVIFERHHQALHRYCHSILGNGHDAADALQNTMLKALRALPGETRTIALKPWLYRIAHNESISLLRARRGDSNLDAAADVGDPGAATIVESRERLRDLTSDLQELTEQQRGALLMRELGGLEFSEVAGALQVNATAAKQSVYEARCALQSMQEGRAMDCDLVRRTLSDGDRRTLRNLKIRGHLRACAGCRDFELALNQRPAHLAALAPPLPLAVGASILQGLLGGGGGGCGGGGLLAALGIGASSAGGASLTTKVATVAVIASTIGGGAVVTAPVLDAAAPDHATTSTVPGTAPAGAPRRAAAPRPSVADTPAVEGEAALAGAVTAGRQVQVRASADRGIGDGASPSTSPKALQAAVDRRAANARPSAGAGPSAPVAAGTPPAASSGGQRSRNETRAAGTPPAPQAPQEPVADASRPAPGPASTSTSTEIAPAPRPISGEPSYTAAGAATAAAVTSPR